METVVCGKTAGNKPQGGSGWDAPSKGRRSGGGPLNKGVIQLLYAGTGRESRTFSGPEATSVSDHEELAEPAVAQKWERTTTGQGRSLRTVEGEGICDGHEEGTAPGEGGVVTVMLGDGRREKAFLP